MGHYDIDDHYKQIAEENRRNDLVLNKLTDHQKAAAVLAFQIKSAKYQISQLTSSLKTKQRRLKKLKTRVPRIDAEAVRHIEHRHSTLTVKNLINGKGWDDDQGWF